MIVETEDKTGSFSQSVEDVESHETLSEDTLVKHSKKMKYLVADTAAFIKNVPMHEYADDVISTRDVIDEIRDRETKQRLLACPIEIQYREPDPQSIKKGNIWMFL